MLCEQYIILNVEQGVHFNAVDVEDDGPLKSHVRTLWKLAYTLTLPWLTSKPGGLSDLVKCKLEMIQLLATGQWVWEMSWLAFAFVVRAY
jgi:hypothetical protein